MLTFSQKKKTMRNRGSLHTMCSNAAQFAFQHEQLHYSAFFRINNVTFIERLQCEDVDQCSSYVVYSHLTSCEGACFLATRLN